MLAENPVLAESPGHGLTREQIQGAVDAQRADSQRLADERRASLAAIPGFQRPVALSDLSDGQMTAFDAVFVPGGHGPMADLSGNPDAGRLLAALHRRGAAPIAALCHGPALLLSAPERADGLWLFDGYRLTSFTDEEEDQTEAGLGMEWYPRHRAEERGRRLRRRSRGVGLARGRRPESHHRAEPLLDRGDRGCGHQEAARPGPGGSRMTGTPTQTVRAFLDAFARHDVGAAMAVVDPQVSVTVHPLAVHGQGAVALRTVLAELVRGLSRPDDQRRPGHHHR